MRVGGPDRVGAIYRHTSGARKNRPPGQPAADADAMEDGGAAEDIDEASITAEEELAAEIVRRARRVGLVARWESRATRRSRGWRRVAAARV